MDLMWLAMLLMTPFEEVLEVGHGSDNMCTSCCLSPLAGYESRLGHVRKLPMTWG